MATTIVLKNSVTTTNTPSSLAQGEVAINVTDKKVWVGNAATTPIQIVNGGPDGVFTSVTDSGLTNTRVTYAGAGGLLKDSASITTDGTTITAAFSGAHNGTVGATTPSTGAFTTASLKGTTSGTVTLAVPAVAGTNTVTVPASTGTIALTSDVFGIGQTWQNVTSSRAVGTTYTNSTGKPITVCITYTMSAGNSVQGLTIDGTVVYAGAAQTLGLPSSFTLIVPNGSTYVTVSNSGTITLVTWAELR